MNINKKSRNVIRDWSLKLNPRNAIHVIARLLRSSVQNTINPICCVCYVENTFDIFWLQAVAFLRWQKMAWRKGHCIMKTAFHSYGSLHRWMFGKHSEKGIEIDDLHFLRTAIFVGGMHSPVWQTISFHYTAWVITSLLKLTFNFSSVCCSVFQSTVWQCRLKQRRSKTL